MALVGHPVKKHNNNGFGPPTVTDDLDSGYTVGSAWWDVVNNAFYVCKDPVVGAAVWTIIYPNPAVFDNLTNVRAYGSFYISTPASNTVILNTWKTIDGKSTAGLCNNFTYASNKLTYTGATPRSFSVTYDAYIIPDIAGAWSFAIGKNGLTPEPASLLEFDALLTGSPISGSCIVTLSNGEFIQPIITSRSDLTLVSTVNKLSIIVRQEN
jgi:hypothetical protein